MIWSGVCVSAIVERLEAIAGVHTSLYELALTCSQLFAGICRINGSNGPEPTYGGIDWAPAGAISDRQTSRLNSHDRGWDKGLPDMRALLRCCDLPLLRARGERDVSAHRANAKAILPRCQGSAVQSRSRRRLAVDNECTSGAGL